MKGATIGNDHSAHDDERLLDIARRLLEGEAIDWEREGTAEIEVREGMKRLQRLLRSERPASEGTTATDEAPPPEPPAPPPPLRPPPPPRQREDRFIGDFRLVRKLGEGGMGVVYEAEEQHPRRPVALKVIRGGAHVSSDTLKLFQRESSTLARLRHPGIAALYETGATEDGLHYFAMELVRGATLSAWLGKRPAGPITPNELKLRLSVFKKICDAVAYAHQRGVIHRDLKPANVLIPKTSESSSMTDAVPDVKVLDFGLARMTDSDVQATTYVTEMGKVQGTLPYMSPEQVRGNPDEIDLRTDVYSLGVILYEMVTGRLPYDLTRAQIPEAVRIICEQAPKSISTTFSGTKRLDADVITIAGKCLEKEASRRYQSAAQLGEDVQRYLTDQTILARPPSAAYQFRKLAARHKGAVAFAGTVFILVTTLAVTSTVQAIRIAKERDRANQEAETARQVSEFLEGLFKVSDPSEARGQEVTAREILDVGAERIERELKEQPRARARLLATMGETYLSLGLCDRAERLLGLSRQATGEAFGSDGVDYAHVLVALGMNKSAQGLHRESAALARDALSILERLAPPDDSTRLKADWLLGVSLSFTGDIEGGFRRLEDGLRAIDASRRPDDRLKIWFLNDLGNASLGMARIDDAMRYFEQAQDLRERVYRDEFHPERLNGLNALAYTLMLQGNTARARPLAESGVRLHEKVHGATGVSTANMIHTLAEIDRLDGRLSESRAACERVLSIYDALGLSRSPGFIPVLVTFARVEEAEGHVDAAERRLEEAIEIVTSSVGYDSPAQLDAIDALVQLLRRHARHAEADALDQRGAEIRRKSGQRSSIPAGPTTPASRIEQDARP